MPPESPSPTHYYKTYDVDAPSGPFFHVYEVTDDGKHAFVPPTYYRQTDAEAAVRRLATARSMPTRNTLDAFYMRYGEAIRTIPETEIAFVAAAAGCGLQSISARTPYPSSRLYPGCIIQPEETMRRRSPLGIPDPSGDGQWLVIQEGGSCSMTGRFRIIPLARVRALAGADPTVPEWTTQSARPCSTTTPSSP